MKSFLQGKWLGHPLHSLLVHLPAPLWPAAFVLDLLTFAGVENNALVQASFYAMGLGVAFAVLAVPTGLADWLDVKRENPAWRLGLIHLILNLLATGVWAVNLLLRLDTYTVATSVSVVQLGLSLAGALLVVVSTYLGERMVFAHGISVARVSKGRWRRIAEMGAANLPSE
jgi:uncharacterized membrane protein